MGTTSEHIAASFRTEATLTGREAHLTGFLFQDKAPPKAHRAKLTFRLCSFSGPLSLSDLLFSAVLLSSACNSTDTGVTSRIKQGCLAGESVPDPVPTRTCKNWACKPRKCQQKRKDWLLGP